MKKWGRKVQRLIPVILMLFLTPIGLNAKHNHREAHTRIIFSSPSPADSTFTNVIVVSVRKECKRDGRYSLSINTPSVKGYKPMLVYYGSSIVIDTLSSIQDAVRKLQPQRNTLIYVHGYGRKFEHILGNAKRLADRYGVNVIAFDWPSKCVNFARAQSNVKKTTPAFMQLLTDLKQVVSLNAALLNRVSLMMHSLGNSYYVELINSDPHTTIFMDHPFLSNIIFNSSAIPVSGHSFYLNNYNQSTKIYVVQNQRDNTLRAAEFMLWTSMLGRDASGDNSCNAVYLDFSKIAESNHTFFLGNTEVEYKNPVIFNVYNQLFNGSVINLSKDTLLVSKVKGDLYEVNTTIPASNIK